MIRAIYAYDLTAARQFAAEHAPDLDLTGLEQCGSALEVRNGDVLAALMLYAWTDNQTMQLHVVASPEFRGRWTRRLVADMHAWPRLLGAEHLVTKASTPEVARALGQTRQGWRQEPDGNWICDL